MKTEIETETPPLSEADEQRLSDLAAQLPGNGRAIAQILNGFYEEQPRSTFEYLLALKTNTNRPDNVRPVHYPPEIFTDWNEVQDRVHHTIKRMGIFAPVTSPKTLAGLLVAAEPEFVLPADMLNQLRQIGTAIDESLAEMNNWTVQKADSFFSNQSSELAKKFSSGKIDDVLIRARDEIRLDYKKKRDAIEMRIKPLSEKARELAKPLIESAMTAVVSRMAHLEVSERQTAAEHEIPWVASHLWKCGATLVMRLSNPILHQEIHPRKMLAGIAEF